MKWDYEYFHNIKKFFINTSDGVPPDGTPQEVIHTFQLGLVVVFYFLAAVGFIFSVTCLLFNFEFRNRRWWILSYFSIHRNVYS